MAFQNLQDGNKVFILHKVPGAPYVEEAAVCNMSRPMPKYPNGQPVYGQPFNIEMVVNFSVRGGDGKLTPYNGIPITSDIVEYGQDTVLTLTKEAMVKEVANYTAKRQSVIDDYSAALHDIDVLGSITAQLDPEIAKRKQLEVDNATMRNELSQLRGELSGMKEMLAQALGEKEKSKPKKE